MKCIRRVFNVVKMCVCHGSFLYFEHLKFQISVVCVRLFVFGGYGPDVDQYLHGVGDFFWDAVSLFS